MTKSKHFNESILKKYFIYCFELKTKYKYITMQLFQLYVMKGEDYLFKV